MGNVKKFIAGFLAFIMILSSLPVFDTVAGEQLNSYFGDWDFNQESYSSSDINSANNNSVLATPTYIDVKEQNKKLKVIVKYKNLAESNDTLENIEQSVKQEMRSGVTASVSSLNSFILLDTENHYAKDSVTEYTDVSITVETVIEKLDINVLSIDAGDQTDLVLQTIEKNENIEFVQLNYTFEPLTMPKEEHFQKQWGLNNTGCEINGKLGLAHIDIGVLPVWEKTAEKSNVKVAVIDTGIDISHEDLKGVFIDGWDFANQDNTVFDVGDPGHGTQVSGVIASNHNELGIAGVSPNIEIVPIKFIENGIGYTSDLLEAIDYAREQGASIINCSWGSTVYNPALEEAIRLNEDILFVCAAGNTGSEKAVYPASFNLKNVISVAAVDQNGYLVPSSNYGPMVHIAAPGENIYTTIPDNQYDFQNGTSL